jgi:hypothetical protein
MADSVLQGRRDKNGKLDQARRAADRPRATVQEAIKGRKGGARPARVLEGQAKGSRSALHQLEEPSPSTTTSTTASSTPSAGRLVLNNSTNGKYQKASTSSSRACTRREGLEVESVAAGGLTGNGKKVSPANIKKFLLQKLGLKEKDEEQLEKDWRTFIENIPIAGPEARLKRGMYLMNRGDFENAHLDLDAAISAGTNDPRAFWARGKCAMFKKGPKAGIEDLKKAVAMEPLNQNFRYDLSCALAGRISFGSRFGGGGISFSINEDVEEKKIDNPEAKREAGWRWNSIPRTTATASGSSAQGAPARALPPLFFGLLGSACVGTRASLPT